MAALLFCSGQLYFWFWEANWLAVMLTSAWALGWQVPLFFCLDHFPKKPTLQGSLGSLDLSDFLLCVFCGYMHMVMHGQHIILYFTIIYMHMVDIESPCAWLTLSHRAHGWHWVTVRMVDIVSPGAWLTLSHHAHGWHWVTMHMVDMEFTIDIEFTIILVASMDGWNRLKVRISGKGCSGNVLIAWISGRGEWERSVGSNCINVSLHGVSAWYYTLLCLQICLLHIIYAPTLPM